MTLNTKLNRGLGFLFAIIFGLVLACLFYVQKLAADSDNILNANYVSVVYAKNLGSAFAVIHSGTLAKALGRDPDPVALGQAKAAFDKNLLLEQHNLTEPNEGEYVEGLTSEYAAFQKLSGELTPGAAGQALYLDQVALSRDRIRASIDKIFDVNMQAILHKNQLAKESAKRVSQTMVALGAFFLVLALGYFWYFPFYVSNSLSYLAAEMKALLADAGVDGPPKSTDELFVILGSIELLRARWKLAERPAGGAGPLSASP